MNKLKADFIGAVVLIILAFIYGYLALGFNPNIQYEPLGPKGVPLLLSFLIILFSFLLLLISFKQSDSLVIKNPKIILIAILLLIVYAFIFEYLGFIVSSIIVVSLFSLLCNSSLKVALIYACFLSIISYFVMVNFLFLNLPIGYIFNGLF